MFFLQKLLHYRWFFVGLIIAILPFSLHGALQSWDDNTNNVEDWISDDLEITRQLAYFESKFGSDELLLISWQGCTFEDPRIEAYRTELLSHQQDEQPLFSEVVTGPEILGYYRSSPLKMSRREALLRMRGWIASSDGNTTCLLAIVSGRGAKNREAALEHALHAADKVEGLSSDSILLAGQTIESVLIDRASKENLFLLNLLSFAICLLIMIACLRSLREAVLVFLIALLNEHLSMALIYYCGTQMDSVLLLTANLTFVLTISIGIHLVNYYRDALKVTTPEYAPVAATLASIKPTTLATITTSLGLVSLAVSEVLPLIRFGLYSAASLLFATAITIASVAIHFYIWPIKPPKSKGIGQQTSETTARSDLAVRWVRRGRYGIIGISLLVLLFGGLGIRKLESAVGLQELLSPDSPAMQDYRWLEENIGPLAPVEIMLTMPAGDPRAFMQQFQTVSALHGALRQSQRADVVISPATFMPRLPSSSGSIFAISETTVYRRKLWNNRQQLQQLGFVKLEGDKWYWRITVRTSAMKKRNYAALLAKMQDVVDTTLASQDNQQGAPTEDGRKAEQPPVEVVLCGAVPIAYQVQQQLLDDLTHSFLLAFVLVSVSLMTLFRSLLCGLICMIPNILPSALVFGYFGWHGTSVEVGTILTASAALGIAVDDSLHFITWFRRKLLQDATIPEAVAFAYRRCGAAMLQTTLICSFGLVVFVLSDFAPISRFGACMFSLLMLALVADLVVLPAILLSPLGRPFLPRKQATLSELKPVEENSLKTRLSSLES